MQNTISVSTHCSSTSSNDRTTTTTTTCYI